MGLSPERKSDQIGRMQDFIHACNSIGYADRDIITLEGDCWNGHVKMTFQFQDFKHLVSMEDE